MKKTFKVVLSFFALLSVLLFGYGCEQEPTVKGDKIILGAAVSLTGKYSTNGKHTKNGYEMAVKRINDMGGVKVKGKTYKFEVKYYDDESNSKRAAQLAERLIKQDKVMFMLGPYSSGLTKAMAPVTEKYKIPMVEANGASRSLFTKGYKYLFVDFQKYYYPENFVSFSYTDSPSGHPTAEDCTKYANFIYNKLTNE